MMRKVFPKHAKVIRAGKNAHRFFYYIEGRLNTLQTFKDEIQSAAADLFGFMNRSGISQNLIRASLLLSVISMASAYALPQNGQSVAGNVQFAQNGNTLNISAGAARSIANYRSFDIGANEKVNFNLPSAASAILNRVTGGEASRILGSMNSNGRVFLVNPNGVFIGQGANINVGGLFATTLNIKDQDFLNNNLLFYKDPSHAPASVVNEGTINIAPGGFAALVGSTVQNTGTINAPLGNIQLAVGDQVKAAISDVALIDFKVTESLKNKVDGVNTAITNSGSLIADGGMVKIQADLARNIYQQAINQEGIVRAQSVQNKNGVIELLGTSDEKNALVMNTGKLDASGYDLGQTGGTVHVLGDNVSLSDNSTVDASGDTGGGQIRIGGDYQGKGELLNAKRTFVAENARINNDAITTGNGGKTIVWADDAAFYYGKISARGGSQAGNGGFVETSGKNGLDFRGLVDTTAPQGETGQTLLDPYNLTIVEKGGKNAVTDATFASQPNTNMSINVGDINALGATTNVTLQANNNLTFNNTKTPISLGEGQSLTGEAGNNIVVNGALNAYNLKLQAGNNININKDITGSSSITLNADANLPDIPKSAPQNDVGNISLNANVEARGIEMLGVNIKQNSGAIITPQLFAISLHGGGSAKLDQAGNNVNSFSARVYDTKISTVSFTDTDGFALQGSDMRGGTLILTALHGGNITANPNVGSVLANRLVVNLDGGGSAIFVQRRNVGHDVNFFSANATGANTQNSSVNFLDLNGFTVEKSNMNQGNLTLSAFNGGSIKQSGAITANQLSVNVVGGGDVTLTRTDNNIKTLSTDTFVDIGWPGQIPTPQNTQNTVVNFTNKGGFSLEKANLGDGNLILTALHGGNITQTGSISGNRLVVSVDGGGSATLTRTDNNVKVFAANITGAKTQNSTVSYTDADGFAVDKSILNNGKLILTGGGQPPSQPEAQYITQLGAIKGGNVVVNLNQNGGVDLNNEQNEIKTFAANLPSGGYVSLWNKGPLSLLNSKLGGSQYLANLYVNTTGLLTIPKNNTIFANTAIRLLSKDINILGNIALETPGGQGGYKTSALQLAPIDANASIGLGGGSGFYQISNDEFSRLSSAYGILIGGSNTTGTISIGSINLSRNPVDLTLNTLGKIVDATPNNDSVPNITLASNKNVNFTGGFVPGSPLPITGAKQIGAPGLGDIDIKFSGTGTANVKIVDFSGTGQTFNVKTKTGGVYVNIPSGH
jgi:filamentous hemagglutinin family protein